MHPAMLMIALVMIANNKITRLLFPLRIGTILDGTSTPLLSTKLELAIDIGYVGFEHTTLLLVLGSSFLAKRTRARIF